jgi:hypothetical protein
MTRTQEIIAKYANIRAEIVRQDTVKRAEIAADYANRITVLNAEFRQLLKYITD